ncbi:MAG TPA: hypothetical protein PKW23_05265 [Dictyoglomaceae bacterium]|nr:hypothetical protein [Dictyoglomaceae bacterium]HOL38802.1 hypothetical protein [Dictyoglomaceae bacterium]HPP15450.1 hypothetical protein [Dictyoglomaceae bacterium]
MNKKRMISYGIILFLIVAFLVYSYYEWKKDSPWREKWEKLSNFVDKEITLKGEAVNPYGIAGSIYSAYSLTFENYQITVLSTTGIPAEGERLIVTGKVKKDFEVVGFFAGREIKENYDLVILEEERREIK